MFDTVIMRLSLVSFAYWLRINDYNPGYFLYSWKGGMKRHPKQLQKYSKGLSSQAPVERLRCFFPTVKCYKQPNQSGSGLHKDPCRKSLVDFSSKEHRNKWPVMAQWTEHMRIASVRQWETALQTVWGAEMDWGIVRRSHHSYEVRTI